MAPDRAVKDPRGPGSALAVSTRGERARWTDDSHMLAMILESLQGANWQRGGGRGPKPKRLPRPGDVQRGETRQFGAGAVTVDEFDAWLTSKRGADGDGVGASRRHGD